MIGSLNAKKTKCKFLIVKFFRRPLVPGLAGEVRPGQETTLSPFRANALKGGLIGVVRVKAMSGASVVF